MIRIFATLCIAIITSSAFGQQTTFNNDEMKTKELFGAVEVYPNPANNFFTIHLERFDSEMTFEITNLSGQVVWSETSLSESNKVNTAEIEEGIYLLNIITKEGLITRKIEIRH